MYMPFGVKISTWGNMSFISSEAELPVFVARLSLNGRNDAGGMDKSDVGTEFSELFSVVAG